MKCPFFRISFTRNRDVHSHDTRQKDYFHNPPFKTKLRKASLRHNGASVWNMILRIGINTKSSEFQFAKSLKTRYCLEIYKEYLIIFDFPITCCHVIRANSGFVPGQWGTALHYPSQWWPIPIMIHILVTELCHWASISWIYSRSDNISACHLKQQLAPYCVFCSLCNRHGAHKPTWVFAPFAPVLYLCAV